MYELKKLNVHRLVATDAEKDKLISQGFVLVTPVVTDTTGEETDKKIEDEVNKINAEVQEVNKEEKEIETDKKGKA